MASEVVATAIAEEAVRSCFEMIGHYISYTRNYKNNINSLKDQLKKIQDTKDTLQRDVQIAQNNAEDIRQDVLGWLQRCDEFKSSVDELLQTSRPFGMSCLCCSCPDLKSRYLASSQAAELTSLITRHLEECKFEKVGQPPQLGQLPLLSPGEYHGIGSRTMLMKEVVDGLKDDSITVIGLSGMAGVGKTTLVKKIADEVKNQKLFDEVALVVVSQKVNMKVIQDQLASRLGLCNMENEMDEHVRRELLHKRLIDEKKKILLVLDDIWTELKLSSIGIPVHGERKGFKILMTSRNARVYTDMEVQKQFQVDTLSEDEAWNLFRITAEISYDTILPIAQEVSQECGRLPLAIFTVGKSLRKKKEYDFRNMLRKLKDPSTSNISGVQDNLYSCIKSSYDYLESDDHRLLLLLCSLFPEDFNIRLEDLVRYSRGLSDTFKSMEEARDGVYGMVDDLMGCNLLLPGEEKKCVTLHDVVRDVCISIASKSDDVNIFSKFDDLHTKLSGLKPNILRLLRLVNEESFWKTCYFLRNLQLEETENKEMKFSEEMQKLRVLEVNHVTISLPSSLQFMFNLQTLSLDYCRLKGDLAGIGSLKMLRVLSFFHSIIEIFPMEIAELTNLECLDLRFHFNVPTTLPLGTLSGLNKLEELYLGDHVLKDLESLKEFGSLSNLHTIQYVVDDSCMEVLLKNMNLSKLTRFYIQWASYGQIEYEIKENVLRLIEKIVDMDIHLLKILMPRVELFELNGEGLGNVVDVLGEENGYKNLTSLDLHKCEMKYLVAATNNHLPNGVFGKLERIGIFDANQLEELIHGHHQLGTLQGSFQCPFGNLQRLDIFQCRKIRSLFSKSIMSCLRNLISIMIHECPILERIVTSTEDKQVDCLQVSQFQTLRTLALLNLPKFRSFGPQPGLIHQIMLPELEDLEIRLCDSIMEREGEPDQQEFCFYLGCSLPNVRRMTINECNNLFSIAKSGLLHGFQKLEYLSVSDCLSLEVVFDFEMIMSLSTAEYEDTIILGRLAVLELRSLPKLKHIWRMNETSLFQNLKEINVKECDSLRYLLTPTVARMLLHLVAVWLKRNDLMEAIIGKHEIPNDGDVFIMGRIVLPKLKYLTVEKLPRFRKLCCSPDLTLELPSLIELEIRNSPVDIFTSETHALQNLAKVTIYSCDSFKFLLTSSPQVFVNLEKLELMHNESMEAIFGHDCSDGDEIPNKIIVLTKLRKLEILSLQNFRMFCCSPKVNVELPSLTELWIRDCPNMIKLCAGQLSTPKLTHVIYGWLKDIIDLGTFTNSWLKDRESKIQCLDCSCAEKHGRIGESFMPRCQLQGPKCIRPQLTRTTSAITSRFNYQTKESEAIQESSNATGSGQQESLVINTQI